MPVHAAKYREMPAFGPMTLACGATRPMTHSTQALYASTAMRIVESLLYLVLGVVPATAWSFMLLFLIMASETFPWFAVLGLLGTLGLWMATFHSRKSSERIRVLVIFLLILGIAIMMPMALRLITDHTFSISDLRDARNAIVLLSFITPILVAAHYIYSSLKIFAYNKRLQINAAMPRD